MSSTEATVVAAAPAVRQQQHAAVQFLWSVRLLLHGVLLAAIYEGGPLIRAMAVVGMLLAIFMDWDGLVRHFLRTGGIIAAIWAAWSFGAAATPTVASLVGRNDVCGVGVGTLAVGGGVFIAAMLLTSLVSWSVRQQPWPNAFNRAGGCLLGLAEGVLVVATLYWMLLAFAEPIDLLAQSTANPATGAPAPITRLVALREYFDQDPLAKHIAARNLAARIPHVQTAVNLATIACDPSALTALADSRDLRELFAAPELQAEFAGLREDEQLQEALERRDIGGALATDSIRELINNPRLLEVAEQQLPELKQALVATGHDGLVEAAADLDAGQLRQVQHIAAAILTNLRLKKQFRSFQDQNVTTSTASQ